jgi:SH3-like domain-containing protein
MGLLVFLSGAAAPAGQATAASPSAKPDVGPWDPPREGTLTADRVNVRLGPGLAHENLGALKHGTKVAVRRVTADGWCEIDYPVSLGVWVARRLVEPKGDAAAATVETPVVGLVTAADTRVRAVPRTDAPVVLTARRGDEVAIVGVFREWYRLAPPAGLRAYLSAKYVEIAPQASPPGTEAVPGLIPGPPLPGRDPPGLDAPSGIPARLAHVEEKIAAAGKMLLNASSSDEAASALEELAGILASGEIASAERPAVERRVAEVVGAVPPSKWLDLLARARAEALAPGRGASVPQERVRRGPNREPLSPPYDAVGILLAPEAGSFRYRLSAEGRGVLELDAGPADLAPFVGKTVGVMGELQAPARLGEPPRIAVKSIHELTAQR